MKNFKIISAVPFEHYPSQKGYNVTVEYNGIKSETEIWLGEAEYKLRMFIQDTNMLDVLKNKDAEKFLDLIEDFGQEKYSEGSDNEAMCNSEDL